MSTSEIDAALASFAHAHGVTMTAVGRLEDTELDFRPREGMRSPKELVFHIFGVERGLAEAVRDGALSEDADRAYTPEKEPGASEVRNLRTVDELRRYANACHEAARQALDGLDDDALRKPVPSPYGEFTGSELLSFIRDEHWHHRGQLYTYLRLLGKEPPSVYGSND